MVRSYKPDDSLEFNVFSIPESHHAEFRADVGDAARVAISDFPSNLSWLTRILERLDCPTVLANFAFFGLWTSVDNEGRLNEAIPHIFPHHAELLQAIALTIEPNDWGGVPLVNEMEEIFDVVDVVSRVPLMKHITDNLDKRQEHPAVQEMRFRMRVNTQIVRNWDYYHDTLNTARKLYGPLNEGLKHQLGFDVDDLLSLADKIKSLVEARAERHATMLGQAICAPTEKEKLRRYYDWNSDFKDTPDDVHAALKSRSVDVGAFIFQHSSLFLSEMYTFDVTTLSMDSGMPAAIVEEILRALSLEPGALVGSNPQHLFLANPVWLQPAIDIGNGKFMVPLIQAIFSHLYLIVKRLAEQGGMMQKLDMRRSEYLEREVVDVLKSVPMARVMPNKKWSWQDGVFETDCLACLDRTLLIVEVKSSRLTQESMKATPRAFKNLIEKLVLNPSLRSPRWS